MDFDSADFREFLSARPFADWFRVCARCGSPQWQPIDIFCEVCWAGLMRVGVGRAMLLPVTEYPFPVRTLFRWDSKNDSYLRPLVYGLKGGVRKTAFRRLAFEWSCRSTEESGRTEVPDILVPPPRHQLKPDHAFRWGQALERVWGCPLRDLLTWESGDFVSPKEAQHASHQKGLRREEREERAFELVLGEASHLRGTRKIIFVDDVVTTGATAEAAFKALGRPERFEVWAIAYRARLAGSGRF